ncbi:Zn-ribbon domain-containing protein [Halovenus marina]|uniref:Zn-ribbon domain-containing protein n=1 Tax=Halovenus marina TaxID=3396621 RepID=UPI003F5775CD
MPHQCTDCGRTFSDGSKEMLSGCPDCGGNTFQYHPEAPDESEPDTPPEPPEPAVDSSVAQTVGNAATAVRDFVGSDSSSGAGSDAGSVGTDPNSKAATASSSSVQPDSSTDRSPERDSDTPARASMAETETSAAETENDAQASARSDVVSPDELPPAPDSPVTSDQTRSRPAPVMDDQTDDAAERPSLEQLREELNDQFESIRVLEPGQYELNLMELYNREEYIIALQEDGKYTIQVPERWKDE